MKHKIALVVWNEFIAKTSNKGIDFSFEDLEKRIDETIDKSLNSTIIKCSCCGVEMKNIYNNNMYKMQKHEVGDYSCRQCDSRYIETKNGKLKLIQ